MRVSQRLHNDTYAPGIPTYGIPGKTGDKGEPGTSMFFTDYNISTSGGFRNFAGKITSRKLPMSLIEVVLDRNYVNGDLFVTRQGFVYQLKDIDTLSKKYANGDTLTYTDYLTLMSTFDVQNSIFDEQNNTLKTSYLVVTDSSSPQNNTSTALLTLNRKNNINGSVSFLNLNALYGPLPNINLDISYDNTLNAFVFKSDYPIIFDANTYFKSDAVTPLYGYSPVVNKENTITNFYGTAKTVSYNIDASIYQYTKKDSSVIYYGCLYAIELIEENNGILNNYAADNDGLLIHFQNNKSQDFQQYRKSELTYYFKEDYDHVIINNVINEVFTHYLPTIQVSLIDNIEVYLKKENTHLIGYKTNE